MTPSGGRALIEDLLNIESQTVPKWLHPVRSLPPIIKRWANGLPENTREEFLDMPLRAFAETTTAFDSEPFVSELSEDMKMQIAAGTFIIATKPPKPEGD